MNGTDDTNIRKRHFQSLHPCPVFRLAAGGNFRDGGGTPAPICAFPGHTFLAGFPGCPSPSRRERHFSPVAYSLPAISRLGYSPKLAPDRAYHNTSCQSGSNTNQRPDKKNGGPPPLPPPASLFQPGSPVVATISPARVALTLLHYPFSGHCLFHHSLNSMKDYLYV